MVVRYRHLLQCLCLQIVLFIHLGLQLDILQLLKTHFALIKDLSH